MKTRPLQPQPTTHADNLERLTHHALHAFNRAIELEMVEGWTPRTRAAWAYYKARLTILGKATNRAIIWQEGQKKRPYKSSVRALVGQRRKAA